MGALEKNKSSFLEANKFSFQIIFLRGNYTKPICDLGENYFAYPWFEKYHLTHLW